MVVWFILSSPLLLMTLAGNGAAGHDHNPGVTDATGFLQSATLTATTLPEDFRIYSPVICFPINLPCGIARGTNGVFQINLASINNFSRTVDLTASITVLGTDSPGLTSLTTSLNPGTLTFSPGGVDYSILTIFTSSSDATGNYSGTITASGGSITHTLTILFSIEDFTLSVDHSVVTATNQPGMVTNAPVVTVNYLGGLESPVGEIYPYRAIFVPALGRNVRMLATFYPNGTQIPFPVLASQGPVVAGDSDFGFGCIAFPEACMFPPTLFQPAIYIFNNTPVGNYTVQLTAGSGPLVHSVRWTLVVVQAPQIDQFHWVHRLSLAKYSNVETFVVGITNPSTNPPLFARVEVDGVDSTGTSSFTAVSGVVQVLPGRTVNNIQIVRAFAPSMVGLTFSFSASVSVGVDPSAITGPSSMAASDVPIAGYFTVLS